MSRAWLLCLTGVLALALACGCAYAEPVALDSLAGLADARALCDVLRDPGGHWDIADVLARAAEFRPASTLVPDPTVSAFTPGTLWFRLQPRSASPGPWFIEATPEVDRAEAIVVSDDGQVRRTTFGMMVPAARRGVPLPNATAMLPPDALLGGTLYVRVTGPEDLYTGFGLRPAAWEAVWGRARAEADLLPRLALMGMVGGLGLFHLVLGAILRERCYLRYAAATGSFALYCAACSQLAWRWLWPGLSLSYDATVCALYAFYLALTLWFARSFLDPEGLRPRGWRAAWAAWAALASFQAINSLAPNLVDRMGLAPVLDPLLSATLFAVVVACALSASRAGQQDARTCMAAFVGVALGFLVELLGDSGVVAQTPLTDAASSLGVAWEALLLAAALGNRMVRLRVERDRLSAMALTDGLTGIANRRSFDQRLAEEWRRAARSGVPLAVAMFDVDCFKAYNDRFGHALGDGVLVHVAAAASRSLERAEDFLARYGGEEFVAVLPGASAEEAAALAEKVRLAVEALQLAHPGSEPRCVTLSGGVASVVPEPVARTHELRAMELLRAADAALYEAKHAGRNQVRMARGAAGGRAGDAGAASLPGNADGILQ